MIWNEFQLRFFAKFSPKSLNFDRKIVFPTKKPTANFI